MRVASYNIFKDEGDFPSRIHTLSQLLGDYQIDVLCLQEDYTAVEFSSSRVINAKLNMHRYSTTTREKIRDGVLSSSNLTILSNTKALEHRIFYFQFGADEERAVQYLNIGEWRVMNTHLCHLSSTHRMQQIDIMLEYASEQTILCGDYNAEPHSLEIQKLEQYYQHNSIGPTHEYQRTLDYIFTTKTSLVSVHPLPYSDHYLVIKDV